jgi:hypothetical protein
VVDLERVFEVGGNVCLSARTVSDNLFDQAETLRIDDPQGIPSKLDAFIKARPTQRRGTRSFTHFMTETNICHPESDEIHEIGIV